MAVTIASASTTGYGDTNCDSSQLVGQSFEVATSGKLKELLIAIKSNGTISGSFTFAIYAHSGTYGSSSIPSGSALATSDSFNTSGVSSSYASKTIVFSGANQIIMTSGERYVFVCTYSNTSWPNALLMQNKTPSFYSGNQSYNSGGWNALSGYDMAFDLQGDAVGAGNNAGVLYSLI